jgi:hypothetical protein
MASKAEIPKFSEIDGIAKHQQSGLFTAPNNRVEPEVVGTATLRMQDLRDVVAFLSREVQIRDQIVQKGLQQERRSKPKRAIA